MAEGIEGLGSMGSSENPLTALRDDIFFKSVFNLAMAARFGPLWWMLMFHPPSSQDRAK